MQRQNVVLFMVISGFILISLFAILVRDEKERIIITPTGFWGSVTNRVNGYDSSESTKKSIDIFLVGDVMLGRTVMGKSYEKEDYLYPFRKIYSQTNNADIVFANLENPIIKDCPFTEKSLVFCSTPEMLQGLKYSGINVVNLANNHSGNYGVKGINETIVHLNDAKINYTGRGELLEIELNGIMLGFLGFNYTFGENAEKIANDLKLIEESDPKVDYLIIGVHWGQEYKSTPNNFQKDMARKMIGSGADLISGHHPHWIQTTEVIDGVPVYYSLGNFVFDQMWSEKTRTGLMIHLTVNKDNIQELERKTIYMKEWAQPQILDESN